jgi:hypothetical protein
LGIIESIEELHEFSVLPTIFKIYWFVQPLRIDTTWKVVFNPLFKKPGLLSNSSS